MLPDRTDGQEFKITLFHHNNSNTYFLTKFKHNNVASVLLNSNHNNLRVSRLMCVTEGCFKSAKKIIYFQDAINYCGSDISFVVDSTGRCQEQTTSDEILLSLVTQCCHLVLVFTFKEEKWKPVPAFAGPSV